MPSPYFTTVAPYFAQQDQGLSPVFQNIAQQQQNQNAAIQQQMQNNQMAGQMHGSSMSGLSPMAMAMALRGGAGNVEIPATNTAQMTGVAGMGNSMGTGLTQDAFNSGIGFNPYAQTGGYGLKY
jgi:PPE-repeat protein